MVQFSIWNHNWKSKKLPHCLHLLVSILVLWWFPTLSALFKIDGALRRVGGENDYIYCAGNRGMHKILKKQTAHWAWVAGKIAVRRRFRTTLGTLGLYSVKYGMQKIRYWWICTFGKGYLGSSYLHLWLTELCNPLQLPEVWFFSGPSPVGNISAS